MKNILFLHGLAGNPYQNWYPYLSNEAVSKGYKVSIPQLPDTDRPNLDLVCNFIQKTFVFTDETTLIGHSSGAVLALGILQRLQLKNPIQKTLLVAGFVDLRLTDYLFTVVSKDQYKNQFPLQWDWEEIHRASQEFIIFHSPDDPFVPMEQAHLLERKLHGELVVIPGSKHFSVNAGGEKFHEFSELIAYL